MAENIDILVKLVDEASDQIRNVQDELENLDEKAGDAAGGMSSFNDKMSAAAAPSAAFAATIAAAGVAVFGFSAASINTFSDVGDEVEKMSTRIGAAPEYISALRVAADGAGTSIESVEGAINKMTLNMMAAEGETSTVTKLLDQFGLSSERLANMDTAELFAYLGNSIGDIEDPILRSQTAMEVFGKSGNELMPMFAGVGLSLEDMAQKAGELGVLFTDETAASAAELNDAIGEMKLIVQGVALAIGAELAPYVQDAVAAFQAWYLEVGGIDGIFQSLSDKVNEITTFLQAHQEIIFIVAGAVAGALVPALWAAVTAMGALAFNTLMVLGPFILIGAAIGAAIFLIMKGVQAFIALMPTIAIVWNAVWDGVTAKLNEIWGTITTVFNAIWSGIVAVWNGIKLAISTAIAFIAGMVILTFDALGIDIMAVWEAIKAGISNIFTGIKDTIMVILGVITSLWSAQWGIITSFASLVWTTIKAVVIGGLTAIKDFFTPAMQALSTVWSGFWNSAGATVSSVFDGVKSTVSAGINWVIAKINALIDKVNKVISAGSGALGLKAVTIPTIPLLAKGGDVVGAGSAIVGEAGPEMLSLPRGARVTPLSGGGVGGASITINIVNPTVMDKDDILEKIGDPIMQVFKQHFAVV